ncbi:DUF3994 domain-containing protein [Bacillus pseudomycoides]|uniref:DUF3994 domain-containing protein n=1 Tax=Bacillus TaxID=1386 RepID=UPI0022498B61|nr:MULTISPECIES: DUF3994 domain-containing protein [Bacillus]MCX2826080.1 DUF3994 domain-containing protein [Bacillus sp. DHT2]MDR4913804.1 DUF3994 domain-containing protein [Bacillus pseudomycoides]
MKRNKVLSVAIPIMLLAGCGGVDKASTDNKSKVEAKQENKKVKLSKEDYPNKVYELCLDFNRKYTEHERILNRPARKSTQDSSLETLQSQLDGLITVTDKVLNIEPPSEYEDVHKNVAESMNHFKKSFELNKKIYGAKDKTTSSHLAMVKESDEELKKAKECWSKFENVINDKKSIGTRKTVSEGDGTVTEQDLKDLDRKAGIDIDAVKKNTTKEGKEFEGSWGFEKDGKFIPTFIFKGNTFETYARAEYPSKKNYVTGTWVYRKDSSELMLTIKQAYAEGKPIDSERHIIALKVQNFGDNKMQLFDGENFQIYRFVKQK